MKSSLLSEYTHNTSPPNEARTNNLCIAGWSDQGHCLGFVCVWLCSLVSFHGTNSILQPLPWLRVRIWLWRRSQCQANRTWLLSEEFSLIRILKQWNNSVFQFFFFFFFTMAHSKTSWLGTYNHIYAQLKQIKFL